MSNGPVPGNGVPIDLPLGKIVFWSAVVQAANNQFVQLKDSNNAVLFTAQGSGVAPTQIGQGFFQVSATSQACTVWLGIDGGAQWSQVLWTQDAVSDGGSVCMGKYLFVSEDGADQDFNDTCLQIQWFDQVG
ncbi:MAG TPA: hypothetical protein VF474_01960 [Phenylobacterium sp.]